jgi:hypothetical protein
MLMHKLGKSKRNHYINNYHMFINNPLKEKIKPISEPIEELPVCEKQIETERDSPILEYSQIYNNEEIIEPLIKFEPLQIEQPTPIILEKETVIPKMYHVVSQVVAKIRLNKQNQNGWQT